MLIAIRNGDDSAHDVVLHMDPRMGFIGPEHKYHVKPHEFVVDSTAVDFDAHCKKQTFYDFQLTGAGTNDLTTRATRLVSTYKTTDLMLGSVGAPPPADVVEKQVRITSVTVETPYACGETFRVKVHIKNGSGIAPKHLTLALHDVFLGAGASFGATIGTTPVHLEDHAEGDFVVANTTPVNGEQGLLELKLEDTSDELGNALGYYRRATLNVVDTSDAPWKLEVIAP
jgi:hypothetical protein